MASRQPLGRPGGPVLDDAVGLGPAVPSPIRVLAVDDAAFARRLGSYLEAHYDMAVSVEPDADAALDRLVGPVDADAPAPDDVDCVVGDGRLLGAENLAFASAVRDVRPDLPVVVFGGDEVDADEAFRRGAADYLPQRAEPEQFDRLADRIRVAVARARRDRALRTFYQAAEHAGHSIYITDAEGTILYVNPAFEQTTGYAADEAVGRTPSILKSGVHDDAFYEALWETILAGEVWEDELVNERKDGERYVVEQTIAPVADDRGELTNFVAINHEITSLKRREAALERQNERLEEFAGTLSHDLRNPLNVATGQLELARRTGEPAHFERAERALDRMRTLIDDALALARQGVAVRDPRPVALGAVARDAWRNVETEDATLECTVPRDLTVAADESRLAELFENLFRNAVEHGGPGVSVVVGPLEGRPGFFVADDGPGIPAAERDEVFTAGFTTSADGTGLGLPIVREIAAGHDWGIDLTTSEAGGARFEFAVPGTDWRPTADG
ncbi:MAG: PAS domain S-box protein [Halobacteriales archaeon]